jgi:uncharacterized coiled-coil protein SlyX
MTLDHALRLLAMLTDTVTAQQQQIDALTAQIAALTADKSGEAVSVSAP